MMQNAKLLIQSLLAAFGAVWLVLEAYYGLTNTAPDSRIGFWGFLIISLALGAAWFLMDGLFFAGHLKRSIEIRSNAFDTTVKILFADLFNQDGWKAISVNEFFDSTVDEAHVAQNSLHGKMLKTYWGGNTDDWDQQVAKDVNNIQSVTLEPERSAPGKPNKYPIGTTAKASINSQDFLCVAIASTDTETLQASASSDDLNKALRGLLTKARITCSGRPLNIPLVGSGLARTGIKPNIIVDLILLAIFEESKKRKITNEIRIILPKNMRKIIDLSTIQKDWR